MWRKIIKSIGVLLILTGLTVTMPMAVVAEEETTIYTSEDGLYDYIISNGEATIVMSDVYLEGDIVIPSMLGGKPVTTIGELAFAYRDYINSITIPDSVKIIENSAFCESPYLGTFKIGSGVEFIGERAFAGCYSNDEILVSGDNKYYSSLDGILFNKEQTKIIQCPCNKAMSSYTIPSTVTEIGNEAFSMQRNLKSVTIPSSVKTIGSNGFSYTKLTSITIPDGVTSIGYAAFCGCESLTSAVIGDGTESIGKSAFAQCTGLSNISLGKAVKTIDSQAFLYSAALANIEVAEDNEYFSSLDGHLLSKDKTEFVQYAMGKSDTSYEIPSGVTTIDGYAFSYAVNLTSITVPKGVTTIEEYAFERCVGLTSMVLPYTVTSIGDGAFMYCETMTKITLPKSLTSIGINVFNGCTNLTDIYYTGSETQWGTITGASGLTGTVKPGYNPYTATARETLAPGTYCYTVKTTDVPIGSKLVFICIRGDNIVYQRIKTIEDTESIRFVVQYAGEDSSMTFVFEDLDSIRPVTNVEKYDY